VLGGGILLLESSEELIPASEFGYIVRSLGERGLLAAVDAVVVSRPPTSTHEHRPSPDDRAAARRAQRDAALATIGRYNPDAVVVIGVPFGHTRPQWVLPYGGTMTVDAVARRVWADYA
jgi:muramoyltetrapeptide carboxypeptidase LdcA involved in peptidoglycan recycling